MHKIGSNLVQNIDMDISLLEKALIEENSQINTIKKYLAKNSDIDSSNVVYRNTLKLISTQALPKDTELKIKDYLKDHLTNFKPPNQNTRKLIEEIKLQNSQIIKENSKLNDDPTSSRYTRALRTDELIELKSKDLKNKGLKEKLNLSILPNLNQDTKVFMNLDVQYDFIPWNEEFLRRMRLDFICKKDKIVEYIRK